MGVHFCQNPLLGGGGHYLDALTWSHYAHNAAEHMFYM
jgi:hypothetical protein